MGRVGSTTTNDVYKSNRSLPVVLMTDGTLKYVREATAASDSGEESWVDSMGEANDLRWRLAEFAGAIALKRAH